MLTVFSSCPPPLPRGSQLNTTACPVRIDVAVCVYVCVAIRFYSNTWSSRERWKKTGSDWVGGSRRVVHIRFFGASCIVYSSGQAVVAVYEVSRVADGSTSTRLVRNRALFYKRGQTWTLDHLQQYVQMGVSCFEVR